MWCKFWSLWQKAVLIIQSIVDVFEDFVPASKVIFA